MGLVVAPSAPIDGVLGLGIAMMCVLSAADYIRSAGSRMKAEWKSTSRMSRLRLRIRSIASLPRAHGVY